MIQMSSPRTPTSSSSPSSTAFLRRPSPWPSQSPTMSHCRSFPGLLIPAVLHFLDLPAEGMQCWSKCCVVMGPVFECVPCCWPVSLCYLKKKIYIYIFLILFSCNGLCAPMEKWHIKQHNTLRQYSILDSIIHIDNALFLNCKHAYSTYNQTKKEY